MVAQRRGFVVEVLRTSCHAAKIKNATAKVVGKDNKIDPLSHSAITTGHRWIGVAAVLGGCFVVSHLVTVVVTCAIEGFDWGINAWTLDIAGFLAGFFFAIQCWLSSSRTSDAFRAGNRWIFIWAGMTLIVRCVDTLMLFGIVKWSAVYVTPTGAVLWSNVISEVIFGVAFAMTAFVGALMLLRNRSG